jgi:hypothetical protein
MTRALVILPAAASASAQEVRFSSKAIGKPVIPGRYLLSPQSH